VGFSRLATLAWLPYASVARHTSGGVLAEPNNNTNKKGQGQHIQPCP
jgi:hypothetical protein